MNKTCCKRVVENVPIKDQRHLKTKGVFPVRCDTCKKFAYMFNVKPLIK